MHNFKLHCRRCGPWELLPTKFSGHQLPLIQMACLGRCKAFLFQITQPSILVYGTAVVIDDANQGAAEEQLVSAVSGAVTIAGTPADDDMCFFRIFRDVSDGNDTAGEDAILIGIKLFITTDAGNDA